MDVTFETTQGLRFTIQIWYFSTVRRIKEYIQQYEGIPMEAQKLFFMGKELQDDRDTEYYSILHGSHVLLVLRDGSPAVAETRAGDVVHVVVSAPSLGQTITLDLKPSVTVARLKELLQERSDGELPAAGVAVIFGNAEMEDGKTLADYGPPVERMEVCAVVVTDPPPAPAPKHDDTAARKQQRMTVKVKRGSQMVVLEVSNVGVVRELRTELRRVAPHFVQPAVADGGCCFAYKQNVMDEDRTLRWHRVRNGDTIEILSSVVTSRGD